MPPPRSREPNSGELELRPVAATRKAGLQIAGVMMNGKSTAACVETGDFYATSSPRRTWIDRVLLDFVHIESRCSGDARRHFVRSESYRDARSRPRASKSRVSRNLDRAP